MPAKGCLNSGGGGEGEGEGEPIPVHLLKEIHIVPWVDLAEIRQSEVEKGQENKGH